MFSFRQILYTGIRLKKGPSGSEGFDQPIQNFGIGIWFQMFLEHNILDVNLLGFHGLFSGLWKSLDLIAFLPHEQKF